MDVDDTDSITRQTQEHAHCATIFDGLFSTLDGKSVGCDIWRVFVGEDEQYDNFLGENFNQLLQIIRNDWFGHGVAVSASTQFYNNTYIYWLYMVFARVYEVFDTIDPKGNNDLVQNKRRSLGTFSEINLWAKFLKHPKEFIYCHWPEVSCEGRRHERSRKTAVRITTTYLKNHYSSETSTRPSELKNNTEVVVEYPKLTRLTEGFVNDFLSFRDFICKNEMVVEALRKDTNVPIEMTAYLPK